MTTLELSSLHINKLQDFNLNVACWNFSDKNPSCSDVITFMGDTRVCHSIPGESCGAICSTYYATSTSTARLSSAHNWHIVHCALTLEWSICFVFVNRCNIPGFSDFFGSDDIREMPESQL